MPRNRASLKAAVAVGVDESVPKTESPQRVGTAADDDRGLDNFRPIRIRKASDEVLAVLADAIRGGLYRPGDLLPRERDLAAKLRVSRPVVREAIDVLRVNGVVSARRGYAGGTLIESLSRLQDVIAHIQGETRENIRSLIEMRQVLELPAALLTAQRATKADFARLESLVEMLEGLVPQPEEFYQADVQFHLAVAEISGNRVLAECLGYTFNAIAAVREQYPHARVELQHAIKNQRTMIGAIESGDATRITGAVHEHIRSVAEVFLGESKTLF